MLKKALYIVAIILAAVAVSGFLSNRKNLLKKCKLYTPYRLATPFGALHVEQRKNTATAATCALLSTG